MASSRFSLHHIRRFTTVVSNPTPTLESAQISVSKAKSSLRKEHDPDKALSIYSTLSTQPASPIASRYAQELLIRRLTKSNRFTDIETLLETHKTNPLIKQESFYSSMLIRSYGQASMFDHAVKTFNEMEQYETPRTVLSFNALLTACLHCRKFEHVHQLFDEIPQRYNNIVPDSVSYGILIKSYCDNGEPEKGLEVLRGLEEVSTFVFTTVLDSLYKNGKVEEAERLWSEFVVEKGLVLDNAVYNVRLMSVQKDGPERVEELIDEMISVGLRPDTISYNYLLTAYCEKGMLDEAKRVYEGLKGNKCAPNAATFRTLVFHLCDNGLYEQGYAMFKKSVNMKKIPDFGTLKHLVVGLVKNKKVSDAKGVIRTVKKKFPPSFTVAWGKVEEELGLYSKADDAASEGTEVPA